MSIEQSNIVDFISTDNADRIVLTISDHLDWQDERQHLLVLQEKLNAYLRFLEGGEIIEKYPDARGRKCIVSIVAQYEPTESGFRFLSVARSAIEKAGFELRFVLHETKKGNSDDLR